MDYHTDSIVEWKKDIVVARPDRWIARELIATDGTVWTVRDMSHPYDYRACSNEKEALSIAAELNAAESLEARMHAAQEAEFLAMEARRRAEAKLDAVLMT
jgi:hypothetical protein